MKEPIYVRLPHAETGEVAWRSRPRSETGPDGAGQGGVEELAAAARLHDLVLLVPTADVLLTQVTLPVRNRSRLRQATPFALEEDLAEDIEELHFALGTTAAGKTPVAVVARARMAQWLEALEVAGTPVAAILPDVLALPHRDGCWSLLVDAERVLLRSGSAAGIEIDSADAEMVIRRLLQRAEAPPGEVDLYTTPAGSDVCGPLRALLEEHGMEVHEYAVSGLLACADLRPLRALPVNLRQGPFAPRQAARRQWLRWRAAAALLAAFVALQFGLGLYRLQRMQSENHALEEQTRQLFHRAFPDIHRVVDMRAQARQQLAQLRAQTGGGSARFLEMLDRFSTALGNGQSITLKGISYDRGVLDLNVRADKLDRIDRLKKSITAGGRFRFDIKSVNNNPGGIDARLEIRGSGT